MSKSPSKARSPGEQKARNKFFKQRKIIKNAGSLLYDFELNKLRKLESIVKIKNSEHIASYNWSNSNNPVIFVPGCPAKWTPPTLPLQVPKDNGKARADENKNRVPSASFDPFFKALLTTHPDFDMIPISLVTDRNSLRRLLQFSSSKGRESWRIDVDLVEDTLFFTRWEEDQLKIITGSLMSGYGHGFEKAYFRDDEDLRETSGHFRIIRYNLGGVECLVRSEADGYIDAKDRTDEDLSRMTSALNITDSTDIFASSPNDEVKVIQRGREVDPNSIVEFKSRSGQLNLQQTIPQLWISQTRHLFICRHKGGLVESEAEIFNMDDHFSTWEANNRDSLRSMVALIMEIKNRAKKAEGGKCMLVWEKEERRTLKLYERKGKEITLPRGVREKCWGNEDSEDGGVAIS